MPRHPYIDNPQPFDEVWQLFSAEVDFIDRLLSGFIGYIGSATTTAALSYDMIHLFVACPQAYLHDSLSKDLTFQQDDGNVTFIASCPMALALFLNGCSEQLQVVGVGEAQMKTAKLKRQKHAGPEPFPYHAIAGSQYIDVDEIFNSGVYTLLDLEIDVAEFSKELCRGKAHNFTHYLARLVQIVIEIQTQQHFMSM
jgi:hypothetical protein